MIDPKFLQKRRIPEEEIKVIMSKKKPIWEAKNLYNNTKTNIRNYDMINVYSNEAYRSQNWVILWFIDDPQHIQTFENTVIYLAYKIAQLFDWDIRNKIQGKTSLQVEFLQLISTNQDDEVMKYFSKEVFSCFAYTQKMLGIKLIDAINIGLEHLEMNSQHDNSPLGSFYKSYGKINVEAIICKLFECAYRMDKFSVNTILKKEKQEQV